MRLFIPLSLVACSDAIQPVDATCGSDEVVARFETSDGERLAADWWPASAEGADAVVLVHMVPPSNDRKGWTPAFRQALHAAGWAVLNVDRRGGGGSTGVPEAAYEGPGGRLDVEAAVRFALGTASGCPARRVALLGASNGTTSVLDYAAAHDADLPDAIGHGMLSPGTYTENQHPLMGTWDRDRPFLWLYPTHEPWSDEVARPAATSRWTFVQRGDQHGTRMLDGGELEAATTAEITAWLDAQR